MGVRETPPFRPGKPARSTLRELFLRFLRYGFLAWGGPVAQIGLMHRELVEREKWVDEPRFRKTLALYQALPGPEATELAVWFGMLRRGRLGGLLAGLGFILPGVALVTIAAALYVEYAETSVVAAALVYGVRPAVLALVALAFWRLARASLAAWDLALIGALAAATAFLLPRLSFLVILAAGGLLALAKRGASNWAASLAPLALLALKVGLLTFGGAYTAIPILRDGAVEEHGWMRDDQFLDALALSGMLPAPLVAVGTFVGYFVAGIAGALVATVLIFAPAFGFTLLGHDLFERIVHEPRLHAFLLGVTAAVIGLILAAFVPLARVAMHDAFTIALGIVALAALLAKRIPPPLVILASGIAGAAWLAYAT